MSAILRKQLLAFSLLCFCMHTTLHARYSYSFIFHKPYAEQTILFDTAVYDKLDKLNTPEFWAAIKELQDEARKEKDYGVELRAILAQYAYLDYKGLSNTDEKIAYLEQLLTNLDKDKYQQYAILIMIDLGNNYFGKKRNYTAAFNHFINAYHLISTLNPKDFPEKKNLLVYIGNRYYLLGDMQKAKAILEEAALLPNTWIKTVSYNNPNTLGLIYRAAESYDTAISYFTKALKLARNDGDTVWAGIAIGNIGSCYYLQGKYKEAIPLLEEDIRSGLLPKTKATDNALNSLMLLADIHLRHGNTGQVAAAIRLTQQYMDSCRDKMKILSLLYPVMSKYYYQTGQLQQAYAYRDTADLYKDSLRHRDNLYLLAKIEHQKDIEYHDDYLQRLHAEKKLVEFSRNGLAGAILLLGVIAILAVNRQKLRHRIKQEALLGKQKHAEQELATATRELDNYTRHLQEKNSLIEKSAQEIEKLQGILTSGKEEQINNEVLQQIYASTILTDEQWNEFKLLFEQVHQGYLQRLKNKMPDLTPADTKFMVLSKLKLNNKEMAGILGVLPDTIRSHKHRLRKRFSLQEDAAIRELVDTI